MNKYTSSARLWAVAYVAIGLTGAEVVSTMASKGYPSAEYFAWSALVIAFIVLFSILAVIGLYRFTAQSDHRGYIRTPRVIESIAGLFCTLCVSLLFLFLPTVSGDDGGLFGGCVYYVWVFAVPRCIYCESNGEYCNPGFVVHWFMAIEVVMVLGLNACLITRRRRLPLRPFIGSSWLLLMLFMPFTPLTHGWIMIYDVYIYAIVCALAGLYQARKLVRTSRRVLYGAAAQQG